jgi:hypothetical protein
MSEKEGPTDLNNMEFINENLLQKKFVEIVKLK